MIPTVAFDEAGNTGQNLLDPDQPVFVSCGVLFSDDEIGELRELLEWAVDEELHFSRLKRSRAGRRRIVRLYDSPLITTERAKGFAIHKPFMVTTKVIDILMEELAYRMGVNMYADGAAHATANLFYNVGPVFCGPELYHEMLDRFVAMIRTRDRDAARAFYATLRQMYERCSDGTFQSAIATLIATETIIEDVLSQADITDLDPAIPAFVASAVEWDLQLQTEWHVVHDDSKPIAYDQELIECYFDNGETEREGVGQGDHYAEFPLRATKLALRPSHEVPQLQVADLIASSVAHLQGGIADPSLKDRLWDELLDSPFAELGCARIWPGMEVDPEKLGRRGDDGRGVELAAELVDGGMTRKHGPEWRGALRKRRGR